MMLFTQNENLGVLWETQEDKRGVQVLLKDELFSCFYSIEAWYKTILKTL